MAYSEDNSRGDGLRDYVRREAPHLVVVTKKETRIHCFVLERKTGRVLWELEKNNSLENMLTDPSFDITKPPKLKGLRLSLSPDPDLKNWIQKAEKELAFWSGPRGRNKNPGKAATYAKCWELELKELRGRDMRI